jgi:hypothetical protein
MPIPVNPPELIISLSHDMVRVHLLAKPDQGRASWQSDFTIEGDFLEEQISSALDTALSQNPSLVDHFKCVEVVVLDRPNIFIPHFYVGSGKIKDIARRYLRLRVGDTLTTDQTVKDTVIAYTLPADTVHVFKEYYVNISQVHLASLLWSKLSSPDIVTAKDQSRLCFLVTGHTLLIMGDRDGKLIFSRIFTIQDQSDLVYYTLACSRMLRLHVHWYVTIKNDSTSFGWPPTVDFTIDHHLELPELPLLVAQHRLCES